MKNLGQMMKQVQGMQARMAETQEKMAAMEITGTSGGGLVQAAGGLAHGGEFAGVL